MLRLLTLAIVTILAVVVLGSIAAATLSVFFGGA
jgi:predicted RNase H-like HicB family nuclease